MTALWTVVRLTHFIGGSVIMMPISFHKTETEAQGAKVAEIARMQQKFASNGAHDLLQQLGIAAIAFEIGAFETPHDDLIKVPRLIMPPS